MERLFHFSVYDQVYPMMITSTFLLQSASTTKVNERDCLNRDVEAFNQSATRSQTQL